LSLVRATVALDIVKVRETMLGRYPIIPRTPAHSVLLAPPNDDRDREHCVAPDRNAHRQ